MHHHCQCREPFVVINILFSMLLEGVHCALGVLQQWALNICAQELRSDIHIQVLTNGPPIGKREILPLL